MVKLFDRVKVNIATTGTGDITFGAAASTAFLTPTEAGVLDGDEVRYVIVDGLDFEEGVGLIKDTVATMERTVTKSKVGGVVGTSALNLSGTAVLALTASAADILTPDDNLAGLTDPSVARDNLGVSYASQSEAEEQDDAVASNVKVATPLRVLQAVRAGIKEHGYVTPLMLGADRTGGTNTVTEVQGAIDEAIDNNCEWRLPRGIYRCDTAVNVSQRISMRGAGMRNSIISGRQDGSGVLIIQPTTSSPSNEKNAFFDFSDFAVEQNDGLGGAGINCVLGAGAYMAQFVMERLYVGITEGPGISFDNNIDNMDGFFTFAVRDSYISGGILGAKVGDSINIERNQLVVGAAGTCGVRLTGKAGAHQTLIRDNNITTTGGAIALTGVEKALIENNQCEHPVSVRDYDGSFDAAIYLADCLQARVQHNTISPGPTAGHVAANYALLFDGTCTDCSADDNIISPGELGNHIAIASTCMGVTIGGLNRGYSGTGYSVLDNGLDTRGTVRTPTLLNSWVNNGGGFADASYSKNAEGWVTLSGSIKDGSGTVMMLPSGYRPAAALEFVVSQSGATAIIQVSASGAVDVAVAGATANINLNGIRFKAA